jgi:hypothetical protein
MMMGMSQNTCINTEDGYGRPEWTRTIDLFRVKNEVIPLTPFSSLVVPHRGIPKNTLKRPGFGDQSVTSRFWPYRKRSLQILANNGSALARTEEVKLHFCTQARAGFHGEKFRAQMRTPIWQSENAPGRGPISAR